MCINNSMVNTKTKMRIKRCTPKKINLGNTAVPAVIQCDGSTEHSSYRFTCVMSSSQSKIIPTQIQLLNVCDFNPTLGLK